MKFRIKLETEFGWGETRSHEICTLERRTVDASEENLGLCLAEAKSLLKEIQRALLQDQVKEISEVTRVCRFCGTYLPVHDRRQRQPAPQILIFRQLYGIGDCGSLFQNFAMQSAVKQGADQIVATDGRHPGAARGRRL